MRRPKLGSGIGARGAVFRGVEDAVLGYTVGKATLMRPFLGGWPQRGP
jgi:hypothetical protein